MSSLLMETGHVLLMETGFAILLEAGDVFDNWPLAMQSQDGWDYTAASSPQPWSVANESQNDFVTVPDVGAPVWNVG